MGFPCGSVVKNLPASVGDMGSIPGSGRSPRRGGKLSAAGSMQIFGGTLMNAEAGIPTRNKD